jgi:hypothetical protein
LRSNACRPSGTPGSSPQLRIAIVVSRRQVGRTR